VFHALPLSVCGGPLSVCGGPCAKNDHETPLCEGGETMFTKITHLFFREQGYAKGSKRLDTNLSPNECPFMIGTRSGAETLLTTEQRSHRTFARACETLPHHTSKQLAHPRYFESVYAKALLPCPHPNSCSLVPRIAYPESLHLYCRKWQLLLNPNSKFVSCIRIAYFVAKSLFLEPSFLCRISR